MFPERVSDFVNHKMLVKPKRKQDEQKFGSLASIIPFMIWIASNDSLYLYLNTAWLENKGRNLATNSFSPVEAEEINKIWFQSVHPEDQQKIEDAYQKAVANRRMVQRYYRLRRADGEYRQILDTAFPRFVANSNFIGYVGYLVDISDATNQQSSALDSELKLPADLTNFPCELWSWEIPTGKMKWASTKDKLFETELGEAPQTYEQFINCLYAEDQHIAGEKMFHSLANGSDCDFEVRIQNRDGSLSWVKVQGQVAGSANRKGMMMQGTVMDITDTKIVKMELEIANQDLRMIIDKQAEEINNLRQQLEEEITKYQNSEEALKKSENKFRTVAKREAILNRITTEMRSSLELNRVLETAVQETYRFFEIDHCLFLWYRQNTDKPYWEVVYEAKSVQTSSLLKIKVFDGEVGTIPNKTLNKETIRIDHIDNEPDIVAQNFLRDLGLTALLSFPIHTQCGEIGALVCTYAGGARLWLDSEIKLLQAVTDQLAIAIDQAKLYIQSLTATQIVAEKAEQLEKALNELSSTQAQLVQAEKMSSLGQLVAGVAHEINNPVNFIYGNISHANDYVRDLLNLIDLYQQHYNPPVPEISAEIEAIDLEFLSEDLPKILDSMNMGSERIRQIVLSLRNFSRIDEPTKKPVDIHEGIDSTLLLLQNRIKAKPGQPAIQIIKQYAALPPICCFAAQLNQVFMNLLVNAIDALEEALYSNKIDQPIIRISTSLLDENQVAISIADNGPGMTEEVRQRLFNPFFTTKPIGKGTGMGLSISHQIIAEKHKGQLQCFSQLGQGAEFVITIPYKLEND